MKNFPIYIEIFCELNIFLNWFIVKSRSEFHISGEAIQIVYLEFSLLQFTYIQFLFFAKINSSMLNLFNITDLKIVNRQNGEKLFL